MHRVDVVQNYRHYVLQPLFRALFIVVDSKDYAKQNSASVGDMSVLVVRTGIEDGLSAPITFESIKDKIETSDEGESTIIKTKLETAVSFVISLEAREAAVFGLQPDPVSSTLGWASYVSLWKDAFGEEDPVIAPSSRFVTKENALKWGWCGDGQHCDATIMENHERRAFRNNTWWENGRKD
jgi:hypothetical protein